MPDIANSGVLILWGYNPSFTRLTHATAVTEALKRGMRLIVVDPRHVGLANKADLWLRVRPGTDGALALGIANLMIERGWYDRDFIRNWSNGPHLVRADTGRLLTERDLSADGDAGRLLAWDTAGARLVPYDTAAGLYDGESASLALEGEYRIATPQGEVLCHPAFELYARLCRHYPPEVVEAICWIPRAQIEEAARLIWHARPASYYAWSGHEQHANVTQTARAMSMLYALTGCFDLPGGNVLFPAPPAAPSPAMSFRRQRTWPRPWGAGERPLGPARWGNVTTRDLYRAIREGKPYPVRALVGFGANILMAHADGASGREALKELEFYAHADLFMNPTAELADIVLPGRLILRAGGAEVRLRDQLGGAIPRPVAACGRSSARPSPPRYRHHFRPRRPPRARGAVLERRYRCRLPPPTRAHRPYPGATAGGARRRAAAAADPPRQACRAGRQRRAARLCHALA